MITNIRKRQLELNKIRETSDKYAGLYNIVSENHNMVQAETVFKHILELDSNIDTAIMKSVDLLLELYNDNDPVVVNQHRQKVLESISKVRDASQFKNFIQRKMALHKNRVKNAISKTVDKVQDNLKKTGATVASNIPGSGNSDQGQQAQQETLNMIYQAACENVTYDRIIRNYDKISKRFDFDKIVIENVIKKEDAIKEAVTICKLIDTYDMVDINKFKIATENYLFVLTKNACPHDTVPVVEAIADYFLTNSSEKMKFVNALESTLTDMSNYNPFNSSDISKIVTKIDRTDEDPEEVIDLVGGKVDAFLAKFKFNPTVSEFEKTLSEMLIALGGKNYINHVSDVIDTLNLINKDTTVFFKKLVDFNSTFLSTYTGKDKPLLIKSLLNTYNKYSNRIDKEVINQMNSLVGSIKESFEIEIETLPAKLDMLIESLESINNKDAISLIRESISRYSLEDIDDITKVATMDDSLLNKGQYKNILRGELHNARRNKYKTMDDYMRIDCIKDNLGKLNAASDDSDAELSLDEAIIDTKIKEACLNNIHDFAKFPMTLKEMNIANTIAMASEKVKSKMGELSADLSNASRQFDAQMDQLKGLINTKDLESENREAVIAGTILPKASRIVKLAITSGVAYFINPAISVVVILGYLGMSMDAQSKERRKVLDEIDLELEMTNRYLKKAEDDGSLEKQRELLKIKKKLESQKARLMYNMAFKHGEALPSKNKDDD